MVFLGSTQSNYFAVEIIFRMEMSLDIRRNQNDSYYFQKHYRKNEIG